jgi:hypothetical protein
MGTGVLVAGAACSSTANTASAGRRSTRASSSEPTQSVSTPGATPATTPEAEAPLPKVDPWTPDAGDLDAGVKAEAARVLEAIGTWQAGVGGALAAARRVAALGQDGRLAHQGGPMLGGSEAAVLEILEAQYGGLLATTSSVLVVCRQWRADSDGSITAGGTTVDVRLTKDTPHWRVTALHPGVPGPPSRPISRLAGMVLADHRIVLPPAARGDILSGHVHDSVLTAMLRIARTYVIDVSVIRSGHPTYVFGTDRLSDHPRGRAFDTWRIDGHLVVDPATPRALVTAYMEAAAEAGSYSVGGPYLPSGSGTQFFSDATHHDHVHAGFAT